MGILDAPALSPIDPVGRLDIARDFPGLIAYFASDDVPGSNGADVLMWAARRGAVSLNITPTVKPTVLTNAANGHRLVRFGTSSYLRDITSLLVGAPSGGWPQPLSFAFVFRAVNHTAAANMFVIGASTAKIQIASGGQTLFANAGGDTDVKGPEINDGNLHVCVVVLTTGGWQIYIDGYQVGANITQQQSTGALGTLAIGPGLATALGASQFYDYGDVAVMSSTLSPSRVDSITQALGAKFGITDLGRQVNGVGYIDTTDANGIALRVWLPPGNGSVKLAIWCHPYLASEQITAGVNVYPWIHALIQEGWAVVASNMHGDNWGKDAAQTDILAARTKVNTLRTVTDTMLLAGSMGGLSAALAVSRGTLPDLRGVAIADGVLDLVWAYTGNSNAYQTAINTAYGISAVGSIPSANDPMQQTASLFTSMKWRFYASTTDTSVTKVNNTDAFRTKIAAAAVKGLVTHNTSGHLNAGAFPPHDLMTFARTLA